MKTFYTFIFSALFTINSFSQTHRFDFAKSFSPTLNEYGYIRIYQTTTDSIGNFYSIGSFSGVIDFIGSSDSLSLSAQGFRDAFILKHNSDSTFAWCKQIGSPQGNVIHNSTANIYDIKIDSSNNSLYIVGSFRDSVDFNPDSTIQEIHHSNNTNSCFISNFSLNGDLQWVKTIKNAYARMDISSDNSIYLAGDFRDTIHFTNLNSNQILVSNGNKDGFIAKLTNDGSLIWVKQIGGTGDDSFNKIKIDNENNLILSGSYNGLADLNPDPNIDSILFSVLNFDCFIEKIDTAGQLIWLKTYINNNGNYTPTLGSNSLIFIYDIEIDNNNNIILVGNVNDTIDFDFSTNTALSVDINKNAFIHKISSNGHHIWSERFGGDEYNEWWASVAIDSLNNIYSFGQFYHHISDASPIDFDPGPGFAYLPVPYEWDAYILKLSENGDYIWAKKMSSDINIETYDIHLHHNYLYLSGIHMKNTDLNPDEEVNFYGDPGENNGYIVRLKACDNAIITDTTIFACNYYTTGDGINYTSSQNDINYLLSGSNNCDSIINVNIVINHIDTTVTIADDNILISNEENANSYIWYDCTWNYTEIPNENNQTLNVNYAGHFAVIVSNDYCTDTSTCIYMDLSYLNELSNDYYSISPNPSNGTLFITNENNSRTSIRIFNTLGQEIFSLHEFHSAKFELKLNEPNGIYFIELSNEEFKKTFKVIIN